MTLTNNSRSEKLTEVAKPNDGDFELLGVTKTGCDSGFIVVWLSSIDGANSKGFRKRLKTGESRKGFVIIETVIREGRERRYSRRQSAERRR